MLVVKGLSVRFGTKQALSGVDLTVAEGEILAVLGPSGCGKTTLLRAIAGLQPPDQGTVEMDGRSLRGVPPHARGFGLMFQDYALFPHKTVAGNVGFGLRMQGRQPGEIAARVAEVLEWVGLADYEIRTVGGLSGGEQQRVALARALAPAPRLLMLDEPIGSLDRTLRERLVGEMRDLFVEHRVTALYVTHDQEEALGLADRVVIMRDGRVAQEGSPEAVWEAPADEWVARFLGFDNVVDAEVEDGTAETSFGRFPVAGVAAGPHRLVLRPDAFSISPAGTLHGTVAARSFRGGHHLLRVETGDGSVLEMEIDHGPVPRPGEPVVLAVDPTGIVVLE